jgi:hypothetical protein
MNVSRRLLVWVLVLVAAAPVAAQLQPGKQPPPLTVNVRKSKGYPQHLKGLGGVVDAIDEGEMTVTDTEHHPQTKYTLAPTDLLAQGKCMKHATGLMAYRWADVKKGDSVSLLTSFDDGEQQWYCVTIVITRRPGAKLPESQDPKKDTRYARDSLLNDIDNGEDVDDADIAKALPGVPPTNPRDPGIPAGLNEEYQKKLDAIRAKNKEKEKDLKATPPDKK